MLPDDELFKLWVAKLLRRSASESKYSAKSSNTASCIGKRYLHLDWSVIGEDPESWKQFLSEEAVTQRAFYPFLKTIKKNKRFQKDDKGVRRRHPEGPKEREICCAAHHDSLVYSWYSFILEQRLEDRLLDNPLNKCVLAYRETGRNNLHFAKEVFDFIKEQPECVSLAFDVKGFFDNLDHRELKYAWSDIIGSRTLPPDHYNVFKAMTRFRCLEEEQVIKAIGEEEYEKRFQQKRIVFPQLFREKLAKIQVTNTKAYGIPQGAPLSAVLSNLYMYKLDVRMQEFAAACGGLYRRYSDDILLIVPENYAQRAEVLVADSLKERGNLKLNPKKTEKRYFKQEINGVITCLNDKKKPASMQYLGLEYNGKSIGIRSASLAKYHHRLRRSIVKTVSAAIVSRNSSDSIKDTKVYKRTLFKRHTHLGKRNFISYASRAITITGSPAIRSQLGNTIHRISTQVSRELHRFACRDLLVSKVKAKNYRRLRSSNVAVPVPPSTTAE